MSGGVVVQLGGVEDAHHGPVASRAPSRAGGRRDARWRESGLTLPGPMAGQRDSRPPRAAPVVIVAGGTLVPARILDG